MGGGDFDLRILDPDRDGPALHAILGDEESCTYMACPALATIEETVAVLKEWTQGCEETSWAIVGERGGPALGRIALIPRGRETFEAACMMVPAARGRNLTARTLAIVIDEAFERRGARRIFADIDPENRASIRVFERLGFQREGLLRAAWKTHLGIRDAVIMGLIDSDPRPWRR